MRPSSICRLSFHSDCTWVAPVLRRYSNHISLPRNHGDNAKAMIRQREDRERAISISGTRALYRPHSVVQGKIKITHLRAPMIPHFSTAFWKFHLMFTRPSTPLRSPIFRLQSYLRQSHRKPSLTIRFCSNTTDTMAENHHEKVTQYLQQSHERIFENNRAWVASKKEKDPQFFDKLASGQSPEYL